MKVPRSRPGSGFTGATRGEFRPRHRWQGRQDRRSGLQGPGRAWHRPGSLRRWPDAAAPPYSQGTAASTTRSGSPATSTSKCSTGSTSAPRSRPRDPAGAGARRQERPRQGARRGRIDQTSSTVRAHGFSQAPLPGRSRPPAAPPRSLPLPGPVSLSGPQKERQHANRLGALPEPASRRSCAPACEGLRRLREHVPGRSDLAERRSSFTLFVVAIDPARVRTSRCRTSTPARSRTLAEAPADGGIALGFLDLFSGRRVSTNVAVFFLGIMPYITASIIMQLLGVVIPKLEQWQQEGQTGRKKKITQWTRYLTVPRTRSCSRPRSCSPSRAGRRRRFGRPARELSLPDRASCCIPNFTPWKAALIVLTWTAGTALVTWLAGCDHPARHRQRHVGPHLRRPSSRACPIQRAQPVCAGLGTCQFAGHPRPRHRHDRRPSSSVESGAACASQSSSRNGSRAGACTAARAPTSR